MRAHQLTPRLVLAGSVLVTSLAGATLLPGRVPSSAATSGGHADHHLGDHHLSGRQARLQARLDARKAAAPTSWKVSPGVRYTEWTTTDATGTSQRIHLLDIDPSVRGVSLDYLAGAHLRDRTSTASLLSTDRSSVAGVNANFFDIGDTGAPNGVGYNRTRGLLHAPSSGWNNAFYQLPDGSYHIGPLSLVAHLNEYPTWSVTGLNTPNVKTQSITVFTPSWGATTGDSVINTPADSVRQVDVANGVVVSNLPTLSSGTTVSGLTFVGRGSAADLLATVPVGAPLSVSWSLDQQVTMAVTGNQVLVAGGSVVAPDDHLTAPRTAIGINGYTGHVLLVTVDGRMESSAGITLPALGALLSQLGATEALNFDGGGSSTMIARRGWTWLPQLANLPSEGTQRSVPDVLSVDYAAPEP